MIFPLSEGMVLALGGFIHSTQAFELVSRGGFGINPEEDRERVPAAGNVQRGLFYLDKGDVRGCLFSSPLPPISITRFQAPKEQEAPENDPA